LHDTVKLEPIPIIIYRITAKLFAHCLSHPNPLVQKIANYILADLTIMYRNIDIQDGSICCCNLLIVISSFLGSFTAVVYIHFYLTFDVI